MKNWICVQPDMLGMSALLTKTMPYVKVVIDTLREKGVRNDYVVLVGGAPLNEQFALAVGAASAPLHSRVSANTYCLRREIGRALRGRSP